MKTIIDIFDIVLLIIILGIMLPVLFLYVNPLVNTDSWGFEKQDDKTMKLAEGDILTESSDDKLTAAEVVLMTRYSVIETLNTNRFVLPNGFTAAIDSDFKFNTETYTQQAQNSLSSSQKYTISYDYSADIWRIE